MAETAYESIVETRFGRYLTARELEAIRIATAACPPPGRGLDVGCDGGRWSRHLADLGYEMTCTDVSESSLRVCAARVPQACCVKAAPEDTSLPAESASLRIVLCINVVEVILSEWAKAEFARVLEPGGMLVASVPNRSSWRGVYAHHSESQKIWRDHYRVSYPQWRRELCDAGFEMVHERGCRWIPFRRNSNSPAVGPFALAERILGLSRWVTRSPWVLFVARRTA